MSLIVEVYVGSHLNVERRKMVASAVLHNVSDLADISNYVGVIEEDENVALNIKKLKQPLDIKNYERNQSVWNLIRKMLEKING